MKKKCKLFLKIIVLISITFESCKYSDTTAIEQKYLTKQEYNMELDSSSQKLKYLKIFIYPIDTSMHADSLFIFEIADFYGGSKCKIQFIFENVRSKNETPKK